MTARSSKSCRRISFSFSYSLFTVFLFFCQLNFEGINSMKETRCPLPLELKSLIPQLCCLSDLSREALFPSIKPYGCYFSLLFIQKQWEVEGMQVVMGLDLKPLHPFTLTTFQDNFSRKFLKGLHPHKRHSRVMRKSQNGFLIFRSPIFTVSLPVEFQRTYPYVNTQYRTRVVFVRLYKQE